MFKTKAELALLGNRKAEMQHAYKTMKLMRDEGGHNGFTMGGEGAHGHVCISICLDCGWTVAHILVDDRKHGWRRFTIDSHAQEVDDTAVNELKALMTLLEMN